MFILHDITANIAGTLLIIMCGTCLQMLRWKVFGIYNYMICYNDYLIIFTGVLTSLKSDSCFILQYCDSLTCASIIYYKSAICMLDIYWQTTIYVSLLNITGDRMGTQSRNCTQNLRRKILAKNDHPMQLHRVSIQRL